MSWLFPPIIGAGILIDQSPKNYIDQFADNDVNIFPENWTARWASVGEESRWRTVSAGDDSRSLKYTFTSTNDTYGLTYDPVGIVSEGEVLILSKISVTGNKWQTLCFICGRGTSFTGIFAGLYGGKLRLARNTNGGSYYEYGTAAKTYAVGEYWYVRLRGESDGTIKTKAWKKGTTEPESWDISTTDSSNYDAGYLGIEGYDSDIEYDFVSFGTNGATAEFPPVIGTEYNESISFDVVGDTGYQLTTYGIITQQCVEAAVTASNRNAVITQIYAEAACTVVPETYNEEIILGTNVDSSFISARKSKTNFSEYTSDSSPTGWTPVLSTSSVSYFVRNVNDVIGGKVLSQELTTTTTAFKGIKYPGAAQDVDVLGRMSSTHMRDGSLRLHMGLFVRQNDNNGGNMYCATFTNQDGTNNGLGVNLRKLVDGVSTSLAGNSTFSWAINTLYWMRLNVEENTVRVKVWSGEYTDEPSEWTLSVSDSSITVSGSYGFLSNFAAGTGHKYYLDWFSVAEEEGTADGPPYYNESLSFSITEDISNSYDLALNEAISLDEVSNFTNESELIPATKARITQQIFEIAVASENRKARITQQYFELACIVEPYSTYDDELVFSTNTNINNDIINDINTLITLAVDSNIINEINGIIDTILSVGITSNYSNEVENNINSTITIGTQTNYLNDVSAIVNALIQFVLSGDVTAQSITMIETAITIATALNYQNGFSHVVEEVISLSSVGNISTARNLIIDSLIELSVSAVIVNYVNNLIDLNIQLSNSVNYSNSLQTIIDKTISLVVEGNISNECLAIFETIIVFGVHNQTNTSLGTVLSENLSFMCSSEYINYSVNILDGLISFLSVNDLTASSSAILNAAIVVDSVTSIENVVGNTIDKTMTISNTVDIDSLSGFVAEGVLDFVVNNDIVSALHLVVDRVLELNAVGSIDAEKALNIFSDLIVGIVADKSIISKKYLWEEISLAVNQVISCAGVVTIPFNISLGSNVDYTNDKEVIIDRVFSLDTTNNIGVDSSNIINTLIEFGVLEEIYCSIFDTIYNSSLSIDVSLDNAFVGQLVISKDLNLLLNSDMLVASIGELNDSLSFGNSLLVQLSSVNSISTQLSVGGILDVDNETNIELNENITLNNTIITSISTNVDYSNNLNLVAFLSKNVQSTCDIFKGLNIGVELDTAIQTTVEMFDSVNFNAIKEITTISGTVVDADFQLNSLQEMLYNGSATIFTELNLQNIQEIEQQTQVDVYSDLSLGIDNNIIVISGSSFDAVIELKAKTGIKNKFKEVVILFTETQIKDVSVVREMISQSVERNIIEVSVDSLIEDQSTDRIIAEVSNKHIIDEF